MSKHPPIDRIARVSGYGMVSAADGYLYRPTSVDDLRECLEIARSTGRQVLVRGNGRSYGDANIADEALIIDMTRMRRILSWDKETGLLDAESGATIEDLWRFGLEDGYWPPVVSGTMFPTLGGALAMNIHGKNNFCYGTLGEHVTEIDVLDTNGRIHTLTPQHEEFFAVISGLGLLGIITRVQLKMKKVESGDLRVYARSLPDLDAQFGAFQEFEHEADYMVSWVDCFASGKNLGRGLFHAAWYANGPGSTLMPEHQDLPDTVMGVLPKSMVWRGLKMFSNRWGMRNVNMAKYHSSRILGNRKMHPQSLVAFSFLLDYVPNWRWAYKPHGFIQYQSFVPKESANAVFRKQLELQQEARSESFLGVMKRHRPDKFLMSHAVDGYSFAQDFLVTEKNKALIWDLAHEMNRLVLSAGGRFYFAKDSTLRTEDVVAYLGRDTLLKFADLRKRFDPHSLLTNGLAKRLGLDDPMQIVPEAPRSVFASG